MFVYIYIHLHPGLLFSPQNTSLNSWNPFKKGDSTLFAIEEFPWTILPDPQPFSSSNASNLEMGEATDGNWGVDLLPPRPLTKNRWVEDGYIAVGGSEIRRSPVDMENISIIYRGLYIPGGCLGFLPFTVYSCTHTHVWKKLFDVNVNIIISCWNSSGRPEEATQTTN